MEPGIMTEVELKAAIYDQMVILEKINDNIRKLNQELKYRYQKAEKQKGLEPVINSPQG